MLCFPGLQKHTTPISFSGDQAVDQVSKWIQTPGCRESWGDGGGEGGSTKRSWWDKVNCGGSKVTKNIEYCT